RVDQVDVGDLALELLQQLQLAAGQSFLFADLIGADGRTHMRVARIVQHAKVWVATAANRVHQGDNLRWLIEWKARLELPADANPSVGGQLRAEVERPQGTVEDELGVNAQLFDLGDRFHRIDADGVDPQILGEEQVLGKGRDVGPAVLNAHQFLRPEVG